jgi:hypothetical protein
MADKKAEKSLEPSDNNDQLIRTVPGTDVGGHDTAGVDGEARTERPGEILGTPNAQASDATTKAREQALEQSDFVASEVDRANREDLPRLGGDTGPDQWKAIEGGPPEFLSGAKVIGPKAKEADKP